MAAKKGGQVPTVCHGHSRPIVEVNYRWVAFGEQRALAAHTLPPALALLAPPPLGPRRGAIAM
jgi:hypothetical protein